MNEDQNLSLKKMNQEELQLVSLSQKGDSEAFGRVYDTYLPKIYNFIYHKTNHRETAEDLTSKTFFKALEKIKTFSPQKNASFSSWIYMIARNTVIDHYRINKNDLDINDFFNLHSGENQEESVHNKNVLSEVQKKLTELSPMQREIVVLRVWEGLSYKEISQIINKSENSSKMAFSRAIGKIRKEVSFEALILLIILS